LHILFMGTPQFACLSLKRLVREGEVIGVVTQPDRPSGRGRKLTACPVKRLAQKEGIPIYQPIRVSQPSFVHQLKRIAPDLIVSAAFGQVLPPEILSIPKICCINLHPSLLPRYRGPAPIPWTIIRGERETGVTIQKMEEKVDRGAIILQRKIPINLSDTAKDLEEKLALLGADLLVEAIKKIKQNSVQYIVQNKAEASYAPKIRKEDGRIDWTKPSLEIHNKVRGLNPYPGAFTFLQIRGCKNKVKIWRTELVGEDFSKKTERACPVMPGEIVQIKKGVGFTVRTGDGLLLIKEVQLPNRRCISGYDFTKGYQVREGGTLGG